MEKLETVQKENTTTPHRDYFIYKFFFLCAGMSITMVYVFCLTFATIPPENEKLAYLIVGVLLGSCVKEAYQWLIGTSQSSQAKDKTIQDAILSSPPGNPILTPGTVQDNTTVSSTTTTVKADGTGS